MLPLIRHLPAGALCLCLAALAQADSPRDPIRSLVERLDLEHYKEDILALTRFGDRREGTARNRAAIDWLESQLRAYGCSDITRLNYTFDPKARERPSGPPKADVPNPTVGGGRYRGPKAPTGVNEDPSRQPDAQLRHLNAEPSTPGPRQEVMCTKIGTGHPDEMYIVGAHMDGHGWGEAANDDASGSAIVLALARLFSDPTVHTDRSIRFVFWNNEETGLDGAYAYVAQRRDLQGREDPPGSHHYPEPRWLGMVQHDMMLFDHGMPAADGTVAATQRREADVNIEFQSHSRQSDGAMRLAFAFQAANEAYATDYPAAVGPHMTNTDSVPFMDLVPSISLRENERGREIGAGSDPHWHQPTDLYTTFSDADFRLGLNAAQTTLGAIARLVGTTVEEAK